LLHLAALHCPRRDEPNKSFMEVVCMILKKLTRVDQKDGRGNTPLHYAVSRGHLPLVKLLLKLDADPTLMNNDGESSILLAIKGGHRGIALALFEFYASRATRSSEPQVPESTVEADPAPLRYKGWLKKTSDSNFNFLKTWHKRFAEVNQSSFAYYKNEQKGRATFMVQLGKAVILVTPPHNKRFTGVSELQPADSHHPFMFAIRYEKASSTKDEHLDTSGNITCVIYFSVASEAELMKWVQAMIDAKKSEEMVESDTEINIRISGNVTTVLKQVAKYFQDKELREGSFDREGSEDPIEFMKDDDAQSLSGTDSRRNSFLPVESPELWNPEKAIEKEIEALLQALRRMQQSKDAFSFGEVNNPYSIFQFMLRALNQLNGPLLTTQFAPSFLSAASLCNPLKRIEQYCYLLRSSVPSESVQKIRVLLPLLRRLEHNHPRNGMTYTRLTEIFTPIFVTAIQEEHSYDAVRQKHQASILVEDFIKHQERLFSVQAEDKTFSLVTHLDEHIQLRRCVHTRGLLYLLDQEVEAIRLKWSEVKEIGKNERGDRASEWKRTIKRISVLGESIQGEINTSQKMKARLNVKLEELQEAIEAMRPQ